MLENVGGKDEYAEAMRYIEIKDVVDAQYIDEVNRENMGSDETPGGPDDFNASANRGEWGSLWK